MGWIVFAGWLILSGLVQLFISIEKNAPENSIEKRNANIAVICCAVILGIGLLILILYGLGWIWYYFCSGFLIFEDQPFWDKVVCGLISLIPLGFLIGFIMICFGWDPERR